MAGIIAPVSPEQVQAILADFQRHATRVARRGDGREDWRFRVGDHAYELHFYPDDDTALRRYIGGGDAAREFTQLQALQKLTIPATRVIANLKGFRLGDRKGDACIVVHDAAALPLDALLRDALPPTHRARLALMAELFAQLESLHRARMCPTPLHVHTFARKGDRTLLADGGVRLAGTVDVDRLAELDRTTRHVTTATDRLRAWRHFRDDPPPRHDRPLHRLARRLVRAARDGEQPFGTIAEEEWSGRFLRRPPLTLPWSRASAFEWSADDWRPHLPALLGNIVGERLKDDRAATITAAEVTLQGGQVSVVVKRPHPRGGWLQQVRQSRVMRAWLKTWRMLGLGFACEVPLLVLERSTRLRVVDQLLVCERVPGPTLAKVDLDALPLPERQRLLYASGRTLRQIERLGFTHCDAKHSNWIAWTHPSTGQVRPVLIDLDGVRFYRWRGLGIARLLRAMRDHPQMTAADLDMLEFGYRRGTRS